MGGDSLTGFLCMTGVFQLILSPLRLSFRSLMSTDLMKIIPVGGLRSSWQVPRSQGLSLI
jgi:hypothetical protein